MLGSCLPIDYSHTLQLFSENEHTSQVSIFCNLFIGLSLQILFYVDLEVHYEDSKKRQNFLVSDFSQEHHYVLF